MYCNTSVQDQVNNAAISPLSSHSALALFQILSTQIDVLRVLSLLTQGSHEIPPGKSNWFDCFHSMLFD
jgi:hypothetical protein